MSENKILPYRSCVGITLFNTDNKVFVGKRIDTPDAWQMPQGGVDPGETIEDAAFRELLEEVGVGMDKAEILKIHEEPLRYDFPPHLQRRLFGGKYQGQEQTWIAARFMGNDGDIDINHFHTPEFDEWQWIELHGILDMIVPFKRDIYTEVIKAFEDLL